MAASKQKTFGFRSHIGKQVSCGTRVIKFLKEVYCTDSEEEVEALRNAAHVEEMATKDVNAHIKSLKSKVDEAQKAADKASDEAAEEEEDAADEEEEAEEPEEEGEEEADGEEEPEEKE